MAVRNLPLWGPEEQDRSYVFRGFGRTSENRRMLDRLLEDVVEIRSKAEGQFDRFTLTHEDGSTTTIEADIRSLANEVLRNRRSELMWSARRARKREGQRDD